MAEITRLVGFDMDVTHSQEVEREPHSGLPMMDGDLPQLVDVWTLVITERVPPGLRPDVYQLSFRDGVRAGLIEKLQRVGAIQVVGQIPPGI